MTSFVEYWDDRVEISQTALDYARGQALRCRLAEMMIRGFEQLSLPIEAAMEDENREMLGE